MPNPNLPRAILFMGPTASGKTATVLKLAQEFPIEIVSVDSALIYQHMDIGTAKPSPTELASCPHHLINIITPEEGYSAAKFSKEAADLIEEICGRGNLPVLTGGTMLYFKALHDGLSELPQADKALREEIEEAAKRYGWPYLHADLARIDPRSAKRLNPNDAQRIQRALEIVKTTGRPVDECYKQKPENPSSIEFLRIAFEVPDRSVLHNRIEIRFDAMLEAGLESELQSLRERYKLNPDMSSMRCVGYRQTWEYLDGLLSREEMRFKGIAATRQLAKRQITWLRQFREHWPEVHQIDSLSPSPLDSLRRAIEGWMKS